MRWELLRRVQWRAVGLGSARVVLTVLAVPLFAGGWLVGVVPVAVAWVCAAVALGYEAARGRPGGGRAG